MNLNKRHLITEELLNNMIDKKYTSGGSIKVGDEIILGLIYDKTDNFVMKLIRIHPEEIGIVYEIDNSKSTTNEMLHVYKEIK